MAYQAYRKEDVKKLPIKQVLKFYGIPLGKDDTVLCISHDDSDFGSCKVWHEENIIFCHACRSTNDAISYVMNHKGMSFSEALERIAIDFHVEKKDVDTGKVFTVRQPLTKKEYARLGLKGKRREKAYESPEVFSAIPDIDELYFQEPELHDQLLADKIEETIQREKDAIDWILDDGAPIGEPGLLGWICGTEIGLDELPELLEQAKRANVLEILELAQRGFANPENNPYPTPQEQRDIWDMQDAKAHEPVVVVLSSKVEKSPQTKTTPEQRETQKFILNSLLQLNELERELAA